MVEACEGRPPLIFPLSNPTSRAEITLADAVKVCASLHVPVCVTAGRLSHNLSGHGLQWSDGHLLFAAGSPTGDVQHNGFTVFGSQANNMLIFPGLGMGTHLSRASTVTDAMLLAAAFTVADFVPAADVARGKCVGPLRLSR